jgi:hypothetical protein
MARGSVVWALLAIGLSACMRPAAPVTLPVQQIAVFPPNNQTGDPLVIAAGTVLEGYTFSTERVTVSDVLAAEARTQLTQRGFELVDRRAVDTATRGQIPTSPQEAASVAAKSQLGAAVLYTVIRQWEPDNAFQPRAVIIALDLTLIDPASGHILWVAVHPARPVPTEGSISVGEASARAARVLITELLAPLTPGRAGS